jgi:type I restriction enzyme R subunit
VINVHIDVDVDGYRPVRGTTDVEGEEVPDRIYNQRDFDRTLVIDDRTKLVAKRVTEFLKETDERFQKTIVFCVDQEHAARMRQALINENKDLAGDNRRYVMRITGNDPEGQDQLGNFIDPESTYPVLVTTSRLLSTGVDAQTCRLIVIDRTVGSMTEFKQILGRGTRVHEETKKLYFTLIDFRGATSHFADPDFDGEPVMIYDPGDDDEMVPPDEDEEVPEDEIIVDGGNDISIDEGEQPSRKLYVNGVLVTIIAERVKYLDADGTLITESLRDYSRKAVVNHFASLEMFLRRWKGADRKQAIIDELEAQGLRIEPLADEVNQDLDPFDLICHVAYDRPPLTRRERAEHVRKRDVFSRYGPQARAVLEALLTKYQDDGLIDLSDPRVLQLPPFDTLGTPVELIRQFGSRAGFEQAAHALQDAIYESA